MFQYVRTTRGFTFIEILVITAIVALLATVAVSSYQEAKKKSRDTERIHDLEQLALSLRLYVDSEGSYPVGDGINTSGLDGDLASYLSGTIRDPLNSGSYVYTYDDSFDCAVAGAGRIVLYALLEKPNEANWASICNSQAGSLPIANTYGVILR